MAPIPLHANISCHRPPDAGPLRISHGDHELTFISTVTTYGTAVGHHGLRAVDRVLLPADTLTAEVLRAAAASAA
jgi:hypothetical protein